MITERCGCRSASSGESLPSLSSSCTSEWSSVSWASRPRAHEVRAGVAYVADHDVRGIHERDRQRGAHAGGLAVRARALVDAAVGLLHEAVDAVLGAAGPAVLTQGVRGQPRGDLAGLGAAHAVGDGEERRLDDEGVLVVPALAAGVREHGEPRNGHGSKPQVRLAHADDVASLEPARGVDARAVDEGAVGGALVAHPHAVVARLDAGVHGRREPVAAEREHVLRAAPDGHRGAVEPRARSPPRASCSPPPAGGRTRRPWRAGGPHGPRAARPARPPGAARSSPAARPGCRGTPGARRAR